MSNVKYDTKQTASSTDLMYSFEFRDRFAAGTDVIHHVTSHTDSPVSEPLCSIKRMDLRLLKSAKISY
jgi:hypothetical protein